MACKAIRVRYVVASGSTNATPAYYQGVNRTRMVKVDVFQWEAGARFSLSCCETATSVNRSASNVMAEYAVCGTKYYAPLWPLSSFGQSNPLFDADGILVNTLDNLTD